MGACEEAWFQTVLDAIEVTRTLGDQYLWVDRLCIDQENEEEKLYLFPKMDMIRWSRIHDCWGGR